MTPPRAQSLGFTLVELLVALAVFALLALAGLGVMRSALQTQVRASAALDLAVGTQRAMALTAADFAMATADAARADRTAFQVGRGPELVVWTRTGQPDSPEEGGLSAQRIALRFENGALIRESQALEGGAQRRIVLAQGLADVSILAREKGEWRADWLAERMGDMPDAVMLRLRDDRGRELVRAFVVGAGQ